MYLQLARTLLRRTLSRLTAVLLVAVPIALLASSAASAVEHWEVCRYCREFAINEGEVPEPVHRRYAPDRQVDVLHIKLDFTPDFDSETVSGTATLRFKPISEPLSSLRLDAVHLDVKRVRSSHKFRDWSIGREDFTLAFDEPLPVGDEAWLEIEYQAEPSKGLYFRTPAQGIAKEDVHLWTQGEPYEARHWFPCFDHPNERSTTEVICHVPPEMTVVSNGKRISEATENGGKLKRVHWRQDKPHPSYLICVVAGRLEKLESKYGDVPLGFYTQPSKAKYAASAFAGTADIMEFFEQEIGLPFPWDKYDQCTVADFMWGGMENTSLTTLTQRVIHAPDVENVVQHGSRSLNAHEMAHQWFGDYVTCKDWSHLWLNEGFATYYTHLYFEHSLGRDELLYGLYGDARAICTPQNLKNHEPIVDRIYEDPSEQFDFRNYPKASWVLHMLRSQLGPKLYREAIQTYVKRFALQPVETENLHNVLEELSGKSFDRFFDQWLYHGGLPELKIDYQWHAKDKLAQITLEQTHPTDDEVLLFEFPTKIRFVVDGKPIDEPVTVRNKQHDFYVRLPGEPQVVRFDPDYSVLAVIDSKLPDNMLLAQLKQEHDIVGRLLACEALGARNTKASIAALKEALEKDAHYGVRTVAAAALAKIGTDDAIEALATSLNQRDARVRLAVVTELANCYDKLALQKLVSSASSEKNPAIVAAAVAGLGKYQGADSRNAILKALTDDSFNHEPIAAAFTAIRDLMDASLAPEIMTAIREKEQQLDARALAEGLVTLAKVSQRGRRRREAYEFLVGYLDHGREPVRLAAIRALGELHDPRARPLLVGVQERTTGGQAAAIAKAALAELDSAAPLAPEEVSQLRSEVRKLHATQEQLQKSLDELKAKLGAQADNETDKLRAKGRP